MKIYVYIALLLAIYSCNDDVNRELDSRTPMKFLFTAEDSMSSRALTEYTTATLSEIGLYVWQNTSEFTYENIKLGKNGTYWEVTDGGETLYWDDETSGNNTTLVAYAPYNYAPDNGCVTISADKNQDFVYGIKTVDVDATVAAGGAVNIEMKHLFAKIIVKFDATSTELTSVSLSDCVMKDMYSSAKVSLRDGTVTLLPDVYDMETGWTVSRECCGYLLPQRAKDMVVYLNGVPYEIEVSKMVSTFESNHTYTFTVKIGADYVQLAEDFDVTVDYWLSGTSSSTDVSARIIYSQGTLWAADAEALEGYINAATGLTVSDTLKKATRLILRGTPTAEQWNFIANLGQNLVTDAKGPMPNLVDVKFPEITSVPNVWFGSKSSDDKNIIGARWLKSFSAENAIVLEDLALRGCFNLKSVELPKLEKIGYAAFRWCNSLEYISLENVKEVGNDAFFHCPSLKTVSLPNATKIGNYCFGAVDDGNHDEATGHYRLSEYSLESVYLPKVETVGDSAFYKAPKLKTISLPSATTIGKEAFFNAASLNYAALDAVTSIGAQAFQGCSVLRYVAIGSDNTTLGNNVFANVDTSKAILCLKDASTNYGTVNGLKWKNYTWKEILKLP